MATTPRAAPPPVLQLQLPGDAVAATFSVVGPLGLRFVQNSSTKSIELVAINAGSQAERHTQLKPQMVLYAVQNTVVAGKSYQDVLTLIKGGGRPLNLVFIPGKAGPVAGNRAPASAPAAASTTYVPSAPQRRPQAGGNVSITFAKTGPLGVKFVSRANYVIVLSIAPASQAAEHAALRPGLVVMSVAGTAINGMSYAQVIDLIRGAARPTTVVFMPSPPTGTAGAALPDSPRLLNAVMVELTSWLQLRKAGQYAEGVRDAFVKSGFRPETWIAELEDMDDDELSMFLNAVRRVELPGSSRKIEGTNGGFRNLPMGTTGKPMDQAEKDRRSTHVSRFYQCQQRGRIRDLESGLRGLGLLQYAAGLRQHGITNSTELSSIFLELDDQDSDSRKEMFTLYGVTDPQHQTAICEWIGLEIRKMPPPIKIISPPGSRRGSPPRSRPADNLGARGASPISVTFTEAGPLGIRFIPKDGQCIIKGIIADTQAAANPELVPNLVLTNVSGRSCEGLTYDQTLSLLKQGGRPVSLLFVAPGGTISPKTLNVTVQQQEEKEIANSPAKPRPKRMSADEVRAGQQEEERELASEAQTTEVTFTDAGSLGITFGSRAESPGGVATSPPFIKALKPGGMADASGKLRPNLYLVKVNSAAVENYESAIAAIKGAGRPITLLFSTTEDAPEEGFANFEDAFAPPDVSAFMQEAQAASKALDHAAVLKAYAKALEVDPDNAEAQQGYRAASSADKMQKMSDAEDERQEQQRKEAEAAIAEADAADAAAEADDALAAERREQELEEMRKMRAMEERLAEEARVNAIVQKSLDDTKVDETLAAGMGMSLIPVEDSGADLGAEMRRLQALAEAPMTPSTFTPGASAISPTIAGSPALSGVLANTEGLSAFEQILRLREVLASMREAARQDAETAQEQLEELQENAPERIQEAYRRGAHHEPFLIQFHSCLHSARSLT